MSQLGLIVKNEYLTDIRAKSFWIGTFIVPIIFAAFSFFIGFLIEDSEATKKIANPAAPDPSDISGLQSMGMLCGIFLALFLMIYGAQIFGKVKKEKTNRVMEVLATCVTGRTMMLGKIISVGLLGLTQFLMWGAMIAVLIVGLIFLFHIELPLNYLSDFRLYSGLLWSLLFFIGGYAFYGSLYAACGAMTDKDNENQTYMSVITLLLLGSFYIGEYAVTNAASPFVIFCSFFPFTAPTIAAVNAVAGEVAWWQSLICLGVLYAFSALAVSIAGKIYTSSLLLKGRKFSPRDIVLFIKSK